MNSWKVDMTWHGAFHGIKAFGEPEAEQRKMTTSSLHQIAQLGIPVERRTVTREEFNG